MTPPVTHWPTCNTCGHPLTLTTGLPVTFSPSGRTMVSIAVDVSCAHEFDADPEVGSDTIGCACEDAPTYPEADVDALRACLRETACSLIWSSAEAIANRIDTPYLPQ